MREFITCGLPSKQKPTYRVEVFALSLRFRDINDMTAIVAGKLFREIAGKILQNTAWK